jgi:hypothetical protein
MNDNTLNREEAEAPAAERPVKLPKAVKPRSAAARPRKPRAASGRKRKRSKKNKNAIQFKHKIVLLSCEVIGLVSVMLIAVVTGLGFAADRFAGRGFFANLLPFASGVMGFVLVAALLLIGWWKLRAWLNGKAVWPTPAVALTLAVAIGWFATQDDFAHAFGYYRALVGATEEAERTTIAHQVYAAYRRTGPAQLQKMIDRARDFGAAIREAADAFEIDRDLLYGVAATESSFMPRDSKDGGHGLFQITAVPKQTSVLARDRLGVAQLDVNNHRHNAFIAAATLQYYLEEMHGDLFLGLLAYNIGSKNGGLRFIMQQYGAKDFVTIQPYLQTLPRDYPIRVLSYALAFRLSEKEGKLPAYEEGNNAWRIQNVGIPGFELGG